MAEGSKISIDQVSKVAFYVLLGTGIIILFNKLFGKNGIIGSLYGKITTGASYLVDETTKYIDQQVSTAKKGAEVLIEMGEDVAASEKKRIEKEIEQAQKGLDIIKQGSIDAYNYLKSLW